MKVPSTHSGARQFDSVNGFRPAGGIVSSGEKMTKEEIEDIAQNKCVYDGRSISKNDLRMLEDESCAVYVAERKDIDRDEVHLFPLSSHKNRSQPLGDVIRQLTGDEDCPVNRLRFNRCDDNWIVLWDNGQSGVDSSGRVILNYLLNHS